MLYHRPVLSSVDLGLVRSAGPGLGNLLFPIARAVMAAERLGGTMVRPTIRQVKLGPILRNERDKRIYGDVFRHRSVSEMVTWMRAAALPAIAEGDRLPGGDAAIRYVGLRRYFHDLAGGDDIVRTWIDRHAASDTAPAGDYDIAVHVRLGDFAQSGTGNENTRIALDWYVDAIEEARRAIGVADPRILLFSDGRADELAPLHARFVMTPDPAGNALASIRTMAKARMVVTSRSTFSMWGAFLGGVPAIWDARFDRSPFFPDRGGLDQTL